MSLCSYYRRHKIFHSWKMGSQIRMGHLSRLSPVWLIMMTFYLIVLIKETSFQAATDLVLFLQEVKPNPVCVFCAFRGSKSCSPVGHWRPGGGHTPPPGSEQYRRSSCGAHQRASSVPAGQRATPGLSVQFRGAAGLPVAGQLWEQKAWTQQVSFCLCVFVCVRPNCGTIVSLCCSLHIYPSLIDFSVHFLPIAAPLSLLSCVAPCSSVQLHSSVEGDGEYLLLEECESKPPPPQTSLWVASHPAGTACLPACVCEVSRMH